MEDYIYHYCETEILRLILQNKTFRFTSLDTVDDPQESKTHDYNNIGRLCFVSCWTDLDKESVEMWRSYTNQRSGVRIGLPKNIFFGSFETKSNQDIYRYFEHKYDVVISPPYKPILMPVTYTNDNDLIHLSVLRESNQKCENCNNESLSQNVDTRYIGKFKNFYWAYQSEWRYKIVAIPSEYFRNNLEEKYLKGDSKQRLESMSFDLSSIQFKNNHIDYPVADYAFKNIKITTSPYNDEKDNKLIKSILDQHLKKSEVELKESEIPVRSKNQ